MSAIYEPEAWRDLFLMIGTTAGALVGLLFIVMSLHLDKINEQPDYNVRITVQGARFNIVLRAGSSEPDTGGETDYAPAREVPVNILIVDDEPDVLFLLRITLETAGYNVSEAAHGKEALDAIQAAKPNLLVTDLMMPVMDGRELIRRVREEPDTADLPVLLLSANPPKVSGANVIMQKPFAPKELMRVIDEMVAGRS